MSQTLRIPSGGRIDRAQTLAFSFDGKPMQGCVGDTLASALLANGVHLVGRSFKYHRPRGILSAGSEEPNALVTVDRGGGRVTPNLRATQVELYDGLRATSQNRWPSLGFDAGEVAGLASPLLSAGFYYKTFMSPPTYWKRFYEPLIRRAAGLGRAPRLPDPDRYQHRYAHCDVLVIGAGPAGLAAALSASVNGARVILCDEQAELGGSLLSEIDATIDGWPAQAWLAETLTMLAGRATLLPRTTAFGWYPDNMIGLCERVTDHTASPDSNMPRERLWHIRAAQVVIATGAIQRPMVFPGNDRPGIMLAEAARTYLNRYGVKVGSRVLIATVDDSAYRVALDLARAGVTIVGIADRRTSPTGEAVAAVAAAGIPIHTESEILGTRGRMRVRAAKLSGPPGTVRCDTILMSGGWTPSVHLFSQSRGKLRFDGTSGSFLPGQSAARERSIGACAGIFGLAAVLESGGGRTFSVTGEPAMNVVARPSAADAGSRTFVDFQNDVTTKDLLVATQEGFRAIEHVKRYTTSGMATDQGKTSNMNALATVAEMVDRSMPEVGLTTFRPPYTPVTFGTLAGSSRGILFDPVRTTPIHAWAAAKGAVFEDVGTWKRARYFPVGTENMDTAVARECRAVREDAGIFDASTLGKIEVVGPDATEFLNRLYTGDFSNLPVGRCRYAVLTGEDGFVRDDGVIARLAPDRYHVTTTTGGAAFVLNLMEDYLQTEFPELRVWLTSVTEQWAVIAIQGPRSAEIVAPLVAGIDLPALPHMGVAQCTVAGVAARLFRVSFTGELGFEINVPAGFGQWVWDTAMAASPTPYGTEAMHVLRAEKGYLIVGQETDGTVTPIDLGLGWTIGRKKRDFVGKRSLARPDMVPADRKQLVGLLTDDPSTVLEEGAQLVDPRHSLGPAIGHVTSSYRSEAVGRSIALALLEGGRSRWNEPLLIAMADRVIGVTVTDPVFHDKAGTRLMAPLPPGGGGEAVPPQSITNPLSALAAISPASALVRLTALAHTLRLSVRASNAAATTIGRALGVLLGTVPNRAVISRDRVALWLGPEEWLVLAPDSETTLAQRAGSAGGDHPVSIVDVSHRAVSIEIAGTHAALCLNAFCALDLHPSAFPIGMCTRTLLGKAEIVLWRLGMETFHIEVARSLASYAWHCLEDARREFLDPEGSC